MRASFPTFVFTSSVETSLAFGGLHSGCLAKHSFKLEGSFLFSALFFLPLFSSWGFLYLCSKAGVSLPTLSSYGFLICVLWLGFLAFSNLTSALRLGFPYLPLLSGWGFLTSALKLGFSYLCSQIGVFLPLLSNWVFLTSALKLGFSVLRPSSRASHSTKGASVVCSTHRLRDTTTEARS